MISRRTLLKAGAVASLALLPQSPLKAEPKKIETVQSKDFQFKTGFHELDEHLEGGLKSGTLTIITGTACSGKSTFIKKIVEYHKHNTCWLDKAPNTEQITMYPNMPLISDYVSAWNQGKTGYYITDDIMPVSGAQYISKHILDIHKRVMDDNQISILGIPLNRSRLSGESFINRIPVAGAFCASYIFNLKFQRNHTLLLTVIKNRFSTSSNFTCEIPL